MCKHWLGWYYFSEFYRACKKCGTCQEGHYEDAGLNEPSYIKWEEVEYEYFIKRINEYANKLRLEIIPKEKEKEKKLRESRRLMLNHFKNLDV